jgi:hypothetical protein
MITNILSVYLKKIDNLLQLSSNRELFDRPLAGRIPQLTSLYGFSAFFTFFVNNSG